MKTYEQLQQTIQKKVIGQDGVIELMTIALLNHGHVLLESVPGTGKTLLAKTFASALHMSFSRIQFTPDILPSDVTGLRFFHPKHQEFQLEKGPVFTNVLLADEINRATPKTQSSLLEVMEERQVTIDGETHLIDGPFIVIATQNPVESQQGTYALPAAQLDRFFLKIPMRYPNVEQERSILHTHASPSKEEIEAVLTKEEIFSLQEQVARITVDQDVETYLLTLAQETRNHPLIEVGISPRGTLAWLRAAKGMAFLRERSYVHPNDLQDTAPYVIAHRLLLSTEVHDKRGRSNSQRYTS
ncbi:MoxR-like ATPase [Geomicrobium sp. JCM 19037]|uniref:AAA family ATPase n=1 Tax=Geomicrobium sp. JCM 19037 TaxID=1460634 RepID=UPI00045F376E|nr:MoxR family ATPase [Geomicrobium sp. JCM 19037]GAK02784.1 MoxR-like ATPase [Geomicrobium sp. JCM 19037]